MAKIESSYPTYYVLSKDTCHWVEVLVTFNRALQKSVLEQVINDVLVRYPHMAQKLVIENECYALVPNDKPAQVFDLNDKPYYLLGPKNNDAMFRFSVDGCILSAVFFHGLTDARGFDPFLKTILYEYFNRTENRLHIVPCVNSIDSPIDQEELVDPHLNQSFPKPSASTSTPALAYQLPEPFDAKNRRFSHVIEVSESEFMAKATQLDASPGALVTLLMANAIIARHPEASDKVRSWLCIDLRPALGVTKSLHNSISMLTLHHQKALESMDLSMQATCYRGMIFVQSDKDTVRSSLGQIQQLTDYIDAQPTLAAKRSAISIFAGDNSRIATLAVSYMGKQNYGQLEEYIESLYNRVPKLPCKLLIQITCIKNKFFFNILHGFEDDGYVKYFVNQLESLGVGYTCLPPQILDPMIVDCKLT